MRRQAGRRADGGGNETSRNPNPRTVSSVHLQVPLRRVERDTGDGVPGVDEPKSVEGVSLYYSNETGLKEPLS